MKQLRDFDVIKGGDEPGMCLRNVRLGYSIDSVYKDAWQAWNNTTQFKNRDFPKGVDIPLYYNYWRIEDGRWVQRGHINVLMAEGVVWNDGDMYGSLSDFERLHSNVKFVGWSDAVNNVKVIEEDSVAKIQNEDEAQLLYLSTLHRRAPSTTAKRYVGMEYAERMQNHIDSKEWLTQNHILLVAYPDALKKIERLENRIKELESGAEYTPVTEQLYKKGK